MVNKWYLVGKVNASSYRVTILEELERGKATPTDLETALKIKISHISRTLKELKEIDLIKCITPELRKNKLYEITPKGKEILKILRKGY